VVKRKSAEDLGVRAMQGYHGDRGDEVGCGWCEETGSRDDSVRYRTRGAASRRKRGAVGLVPEAAR
jgi:hypothetical protein